MFVSELSGCGFEFRCCHLNFRYGACFKRGVPWIQTNYRVWIHSETRTWHDKEIQLIRTRSVESTTPKLMFCSIHNVTNMIIKTTSLSLHENCPCSELFWSPFCHVRTEHGEILCIFPHSVQMRENVDQNNSEYGHFLRSVYLSSYFILPLIIPHEKVWIVLN